MATIFPSPAPALPDFESLLLKGALHASAPIHFCYSYVLHYDIPKAVLVTPSRERLVRALKQYNDDWVRERGGDGLTCKAASRVDVLYPKTPSHLVFLLTLFHEALGTKEDYLHPKTTFATAPSLIVLHELSSYFLEDPEATVSSYLTLIHHALSTVSSLTAQTGKRVALAIIDSGLEDLRLPLVKPVSLVVDDGAIPAAENSRRESVAYLVQRYFDWTGTIEEDITSPSEWQETVITTLHKRCCRFRRAGGQGGEQDETIWHWTEEFSPPNGVRFSW
ncbi:hypothetical protein PsYK624_004720 [Phanerochaete sordida]|uniref:Uncharacterized protein n=1 Tax=Phanerochaete sordida TaxID=48140 RepID=A0A9P3FXH1_9APHY|nr:hypothetical protein PsYK624_004720 [Phanerochaete sordida]